MNLFQGQLLVTFVITVIVTPSLGVRNATDILRRLARLSNSMVRPLQGTGKPVVVSISLYILNFHAVDEKKMEFSMDMYYRMKWNDPRLAFTDGPEDVMIAPEGTLKWFWTPDLFFSNARDVVSHSLLRPNYGARVKGNGDVKLSAKLTATFHCPMALQNFPFDVQICPIHIESYLHRSEEMELNWTNLNFAMDANPTAFFLEHEEHARSEEVLMTAKYQRLFLKLRLRRLSSHYLLTTFMPSALLVLLSSLIYWLPLHALSERTILAVFLLLSMTIIVGTSQIGVPQVGYLKAIDVWVASCLVFIVFNVLEVIILHLLARAVGFATRPDQFELMRDVDAAKSGDTNGGSTMQEQSLFLRPHLVRRLDWVLRFVYPSAFILFNIIYWSYEAN